MDRADHLVGAAIPSAAARGPRALHTGEAPRTGLAVEQLR